MEDALDNITNGTDWQSKCSENTEHHSFIHSFIFLYFIYDKFLRLDSSYSW